MPYSLPDKSTTIERHTQCRGATAIHNKWRTRTMSWDVMTGELSSAAKRIHVVRGGGTAGNRS